MLARSGPLPTRGRHAYELKWDGFCCVLSTENGLRVRSRRNWDMTELLPELAAFPVYGTFDGERRRHVPVVYVIFDVLSLDGNSLMGHPYQERRRQLETLNLNGIYWLTPDAFEDGDALFEVVCERGLEGVVAKRVDGRYRPGERGWTKIKNRDYWRYEMERESAMNRPRQRMFV